MWCVLWVSWSDLKATGLGWTVTAQALSRAHALWEERTPPLRAKETMPMPEAPWAPTLSSCYCLPTRGPTDTCVTGCAAGRCVCRGAGIQLLEQRARFSSLPLGRAGRGWGRVGQSFLQGSSAG